MMSIYATPIITAVVVLLFIGLFTAIPWLIHNYRKYGFLSFWYTLVIFSFIFYALSAYFLVILPLPEVRDTCALQEVGTNHFQLIPFYFLYEIFEESHIVWSELSTYINFFRHGSFLTSFLNVLILFPLGVFMKYFHPRTMTAIRMLLIGFLISLFFETTQITGLYGIYNCPYRLFDVNDLLLNTTGAVAGYLVAPAILALLPSQKDVMEKSQRVLKEDVVRPLPQLLAILTDYVLVTVSWFVFSFFLRWDDPIIYSVYMATGMFLLQFVQPFVFNGNTIGSTILRFHLVKSRTEKSWGSALLTRWFALMAPWLTSQLFTIIIRYSTLDIDSAYYAFNVWIQVIMMFLLSLLIVALIIHVLLVLLRRKVSYFYFDKLSGIRAQHNRK